MMRQTLTRPDVMAFNQRACIAEFEAAQEVLTDWANTGYSPDEALTAGVEIGSVIWCWLRPECLGEDGFAEAMRKIATRANKLHQASGRRAPGADRAFAEVKRMVKRNKLQKAARDKHRPRAPDRFLTTGGAGQELALQRCAIALAHGNGHIAFEASHHCAQAAANTDRELQAHLNIIKKILARGAG